MNFEIELERQMEECAGMYILVYDGDKFSLNIHMDESTTLEEKLSNKKAIKKAIDEVFDYFSVEIDDKILDELSIIKKNIDDLLSITTDIRLSLEPEEENLLFIKSHPELLSKKIIISKTLGADNIDEVEELLDIYKDYLDYIYVEMIGDSGCLKLTECYDSLLKIKKIANNIIKLNLSPMETIMYTYDIVRNRVYKLEDEKDSPTESRNLSSVLNGDKIVCVGYANIFYALLSHMGFKSHYVSLINKDNKHIGHARNLVYVKDPKYDIDGAYYFDATWDSKKEDETNQFLNRYEFFAKTRSEFIKLEGDKYYDEYIPYYSDTMEEEIYELLSSNGIIEFREKYLSALNHMSNFVLNKQLVNFLVFIEGSPFYNRYDEDELLSDISIIQEKFNSPIPAETFIKILSNVRKMQYYQDPIFYPYSLDEMYETFVRSNWIFDSHHLKESEKLLYPLFGKDIDSRTPKEDFIEYQDEIELNKKIKTIKFIRTLKTYNEKRK